MSLSILVFRSIRGSGWCEMWDSVEFKHVNKQVWFGKCLLSSCLSLKALHLPLMIHALELVSSFSTWDSQAAFQECSCPSPLDPRTTDVPPPKCPGRLDLLATPGACSRLPDTTGFLTKCSRITVVTMVLTPRTIIFFFFGGGCCVYSTPI